MDSSPSTDTDTDTAAADRSMATRFRWELRRWRTHCGLTQRALADRVRFSRETVAAVEAGRRYGSQELAVRCDEVLGTGGLLAALWPRVADEQLAADGRRGPRAGHPSIDHQSIDHQSADQQSADQQFEDADAGAVEAAIDELRELLDRVHRVLGARPQVR